MLPTQNIPGHHAAIQTPMPANRLSKLNHTKQRCHNKTNAKECEHTNRKTTFEERRRQKKEKKKIGKRKEGEEEDGEEKESRNKSSPLDTPTKPKLQTIENKDRNNKNNKRIIHKPIHEVSRGSVKERE